MNIEDAFSGVISKEVKPIADKLNSLYQLLFSLSSQVENLSKLPEAKGMEKLLTIKDIKEIVSKKEAWIYKEISLGRFPRQKKMGRNSFWVKSHIDCWLNKQIEE